jgi:hypothetical protein
MKSIYIIIKPALDRIDAIAQVTTENILEKSILLMIFCFIAVSSILNLLK